MNVLDRTTSFKKYIIVKNIIFKILFEYMCLLQNFKIQIYYSNTIEIKKPTVDHSFIGYYFSFIQRFNI